MEAVLPTCYKAVRSDVFAAFAPLRLWAVKKGRWPVAELKPALIHIMGEKTL